MGEVKVKLWTSSFIALVLINFGGSLTFFLLATKMTDYSISVFGVDTGLAALTVSIYVIGSFLFRLFFGKRIDEWGIKTALIAGLILNCAMSCAYLIPMPFWMLIVVRFIHGISFALTTGAGVSACSLIVPVQRRAEGIGYFTMAQALATGVGPFIATIITQAFQGFMPMFLITAGVGLITLAMSPLLIIPPVEKKDSARTHEESAKEEKYGVIGKYIEIAVVPISMVSFLTFLCYSGVLSFVLLYAETLDLSAAASVYFVVYSVSILVARPPVGRKVDRTGENSVMYFISASLILGFIILAFASNAFMLLISAVFIGVGVGSTQSVIPAIIARLTPPDNLGRANSTMFACQDLGSGVGPIMIGAFIPLVGYSMGYLCLGGVALLAGIVYHMVHGRTDRAMGGFKRAKKADK